MNRDEVYYNKIGRPIETFVRHKWLNLTTGAKELGISKSRMTRLINGERPPTAEVIAALLRHGFDRIHFDRYYNLMHIEPDQLSKREVLEFMREQGKLIEQLQSLVSMLLKEKGE